MPTIPLHPGKNNSPPTDATHNSLPDLLQTPSGLAILELQGTINLPPTPNDTEDNMRDESTQSPQFQTPVGRLTFPDYDSSNGASDGNWQKRVHLHVGRHQRLTGEVKRLQKPLAVLRRRQTTDQGKVAGDTATTGERIGDTDELEVVEIVKHKIIFSSRPEPYSEATV